MGYDDASTYLLIIQNAGRTFYGGFYISYQNFFAAFCTWFDPNILSPFFVHLEVNLISLIYLTSVLYDLLFFFQDAGSLIFGMASLEAKWPLLLMWTRAGN